MTLQESIEILRKHNEWRRKEEGPETLDPVKLGQAIELAIEVLSGISLPSNLDELAEEYADYNSQRWHEDGDVYYDHSKIMDAFKAGAEWMAGQFQRVTGDLVDWHQTSDGREFCSGIVTCELFEVPEGFYIRKK